MLVIFANFFPYKRSEPFLKNEFEFSKKYFDQIHLFTLYGKSDEIEINVNKSIKLLPPVIKYYHNRLLLLWHGIFNFSPFHLHLKEFTQILASPKKWYQFILSVLIVRSVLASKAFQLLKQDLSSEKHAVLYFYWGDNLSWIIPYIRTYFPESKVKIVMRLHGSDLYEELKHNYSPIRKQIFNTCEALMTISDYGKNYLLQKYPEFRPKIHTYRLGVYDNGLNPYQKAETYTVVSVSNIVALKRVDLIFEVLKQTRLKINWYHFGDGPLMQQLQTSTKNVSDALKVHIKGYSPNESIIQFYKTHSVDLFINLSTSEGLPVSIMEALSFGIPVIAPDIGGIGELIQNSNGKLISSNLNSQQISDEVKEVLLSQVSDQMRTGARKVFETLVSAETNYADFYTFLQKL